jgi:hypothetical protein
MLTDKDINIKENVIQGWGGAWIAASLTLLAMTREGRGA